MQLVVWQLDSVLSCRARCVCEQQTVNTPVVNTPVFGRAMGVHDSLCEIADLVASPEFRDEQDQFFVKHCSEFDELVDECHAQQLQHLRPQELRRLHLLTQLLVVLPRLQLSMLGPVRRGDGSMRT